MVAEPRFHSPRNVDRFHRGAEIRRTAKEVLGFNLSKWQGSVVKTATQFHKETEVPFYRNCVITVPRQAGKSWLMYALMTEQALRTPFQVIKFSAQTRGDAARRVMDLGSLLMQQGVDVKVLRGIGNEGIRFQNGSKIEVLPPTEKGAHGDSLDLVVVDELWGVQDYLMQGIIPAMSARPNAQFWAISTMGTPDSILLNRLVDQGREAVEEGRDEGFFYTEFSASEEDDPFSEDTWKKVHPALGRTVGLEAIRSALEILPPNEFRRAYCNIMVDSIEAAIPWEQWKACYRSHARKPDSNLTLGLDVGIGPDTASIAVGWQTKEDGVHTELVETRYGDISWLVPSVKDIASKQPVSTIILDAIGPAKQIQSSLSQFCEDRYINLIVPNAKEVDSACGLYFDGLRTKRFTHGDAPPLDDAVKGVILRKYGDTYRWDRRKSRNDVTPLYASSLVCWSINEQIVAPEPALAIY